MPQVHKLVINIGMGEAIQRQGDGQRRARHHDITGQRPVITKAKRSIASFKLRQGMPIGVMVTLRGQRM